MSKLNELTNIEMNKKSNENRTTGKGKGMRFNEGKLRYDLVEPHAFRDFVQVLTDGANKYYDRNWENGLSWTSVIASLKRHVAAIELNEDYDPESTRLHAAHVACNAHFLNAYYYTFPQGDDRPKRFLKRPSIGLDIDGVLADFVGSWQKKYPDVIAKPNSWFFDRKISERFKKMKETGELNKFYLNIEPLIMPEELTFDPHCYITSRPVDNKITEQWLDKFGFPAKPVKTVDIRASKAEVAKQMGVEIFIDDSYDNFVDMNNNDVFTYLYTTSWNKRYDVGHMRLNDLNNIPLLK
jgi:uncharacterized HAD superfamily protein